MSIIETCLNKIKTAIYGKEVRQSFIDAIKQCYKDATGHPESVAAVVNEVDEVKENIEYLSSQIDEIKNRIPYQPIVNNGDDITSILKSALTISDNIAIYKDGTFLISDTIKIPSNKKISLGKNTIFKLANQTNKPMFENSETLNENIEISGGIFDGNNLNQTRNDTTGYIGTLLRFNGIIRFRLHDVTVKDPTSFGIQLGRLEDFEIDNIKFDYNAAKPNMDGLHLNGLCKNGRITRLYGNTSDDLLALNADDGTQYQMTQGEISNIVVDHIFSENGWRAVRILSGTSSVNNIIIKNILGNYTYAGILFSNYNQGVGNIYNIQLENISCSTSNIEAIIEIDSDVKNLNISKLSRRASKNQEYEFVKLTKNHTINELNISDITCLDYSTSGITMFHFMGNVDNLNIENLNFNINLSKTGRCILVNGGIIKGCNLLNIVYSKSRQFMELRNSGKIINLNISNLSCFEFDSTNSYNGNVIDVLSSSEITNLIISNSTFNSLNYILRFDTSNGINIKTSSVNSNNITSFIKNERGNAIRLNSKDFILDKNIISPKKYDIILDISDGLVIYNGTSWSTLI